MALTKEEFKAEVSKLFSDGKQFTDDMFTQLAELVNQLTDTLGGSNQTIQDLEVELTGSSATNKGTKWNNINITTEKTSTGNKLKVEVGPYFGTYSREFNVSSALAGVKQINWGYTPTVSADTFYKNVFVDKVGSSEPYLMQVMNHGGRSVLLVDTSKLNVDMQKMLQSTSFSYLSSVGDVWQIENNSNPGTATFTTYLQSTALYSTYPPEKKHITVNNTMEGHGQFARTTGTYIMNYRINGTSKWDPETKIEYGRTLEITNLLYQSANGQTFAIN